MKVTTNKETIVRLKRLSEILETKKNLETEERDLKTALKDIMTELDTNILNAGELTAIVSTRTRVDLNKMKVKIMLGDEQYEECLTSSTYKIFEIKKA